MSAAMLRRTKPAVQDRRWEHLVWLTRQQLCVAMLVAPPVSAPGPVWPSRAHPEGLFEPRRPQPARQGRTTAAPGLPPQPGSPMLPLMVLISSDGRSWAPTCGPVVGCLPNSAALPCWPRERQGLSKPRRRHDPSGVDRRSSVPEVALG
jgi:hypothetical protein